MLTITGLEEIRAKVGAELGVSEWHDVTQADVDAFAEVTGDHQWIHTDPRRATQTPFGGTVAHGYYTLSLHPRLAAQIVAFEGFAFAVNYGLNKVRFPAPVPVGSKVRASATLKDVQEFPGGLQNTLAVTIQREGGDKPVCIAEWVVRYYGR